MQRAIRHTTSSLIAAVLIALGAPRAQAQCTDDYLEDNDTCGTPTLVYDGFSATLTSLYQDDDYFQIFVPSGEELTVDLTFLHSMGDLDLYLFDTGCGTLLALSDSVTDNESISYTNTSGFDEDLIVEVHMWAPNPDVLCNDYGIDFEVTTTISCQDDDESGHLDNDNCGDANLIFPDALYINLGVLLTDPDYYYLSVPDGSTLYLDLTFTHSLGDIDMVLYDSTCTIQLAAATSVTDDESIVWTNTSGAAMEVKWNVYLLNTFCNQYHMVASLEGSDCGPDDVFEENDVCTQAVPLGPGAYPGLVVSSVDPDYYYFQVLQGQAIDIEVYFQHALGDVDVWLWDACGGNILDSGTTSTDGEQLSWSNTSGVTNYVYLQVELIPTGGGTPECNFYDFVADVGQIQPGTNYCASLPNSSGAPGVMSAEGSANVGANDLLLVAEDLPAFQNGIFYYGPNQIQFPFGNGFRCVGGNVIRLPVLNSGPGGLLAFPVDYNALPPAGIIHPGSTWNFQAWFRDPPAGGAGFNLSDGYQIHFLP